MTATDGDRMPDVEAAVLPRSAAAGEAVARKRGILVVDDTAAIRDLLAYALRRFGFAVWLAEDGAAAVETLRRHQAGIDLILLDVRMPVLDGQQTLAAIRTFCPRVPCCFMSGDLGVYSGADLTDLGVRAVLVKPFHLADVVSVIEEFTAAPAAT